jgi:DNA-binding LacI/PurR family transcriptional regulator
MKSNFTIKDIARELNLSTSTVSRAINDHHSISQETKERVQALVEKLDFRINSLARNLRSQKSNIIGLIVPKISMYYQAAVITTIQQKLQEYGYPLMIFQTNESPALEKELVDVLYTSRVGGLIISATLYTDDFSPFDVFTQGGIPLVFYDRVPLQDPDGVFACNDTTAITLVKAAKKNRIPVPEKLKVVGYSNDPRTTIIEPAITSVDQFPQEVGEQAATLMVNLIRQKIKPGKSFVSMTTPVRLIERASSAATLPAE